MEKIIKVFILTILLIMMMFLLSACKLKAASGVITVKVQYKLGDVPSPNWSGIQVILSGPEIINLTTGSDGKIQAIVDQGSYSIVAKKASYDTVTSNVNGSVEGTVYDVGVKTLQKSTPPGEPY